jgi:hypothetical protein
VSEDGGARTDVNMRIQKAWGSFSKLRKLWLSTSIGNYTKIRIFNACVKSVLLYGCETWLVTSEIRHKIQTFVNQCLRIRWPIRYKFRNKRKFGWIGHILRKDDGEIPKATLQWNPQGSRERERPKNSWRRWVIKEVGRSWNELRFLAADRSGKNL